MTKINSEITLSILSKLHRESSSEKFTVIKGIARGLFRELRPSDLQNAYIAITKEQGEFIYDLLIKEKAKNIIEFGTSFGVSSIYLAAAAKENGGTVITTELLASKCRIALKNFKDANIDGFVDLRAGDAMETLKNAPDNIDFLLLDGWNDLYLPLLKMLEPKLKSGAYIYVDNINFPGSKPFKEYISSHPDKYVSKSLSKNKGGVDLIKYSL